MKSQIGCLIFVIGFLCAHNRAECQFPVFPVDTAAQLKLNALTEAERQLYVLTINPGKIASLNKACEPPRNHYDLRATLKNNSNDTLKYIDWTTDNNIWKVDIQDGYVLATDVFPCDKDVDHNFITVYTLSPHQSETIHLSISFKNDVIPVNKEFSIGMIVQRVKTIKDFRYYEYYFSSSSLSRQTINLIWSNTVKMTD